MNKKGFTPLETIGRRQKAKVSLSGFTLIEIIVATFLLALVTTGLAYVFLAGKRHLLHTRSKIQATELGRLFLAPLQMDVRQDTWNNSPVGNPPPPVGTGNLIGLDGNYRSTNIDLAKFPQYSTYTILSWLEEPNLDGMSYYPTYSITPVSGTTLRRVKVNINWYEPPS